MYEFAVLLDCKDSGKVEVCGDLCGDILKLAEIVVNIHFSGYNYDKDELESIAVCKALELLNSGSFDSSRASLKNYLYSGMRNEVGNFLFKRRKLVFWEDVDSFREEDVSCFEIDGEVIIRTISNLGEEFLEYIPIVVKALMGMGFTVNMEVSEDENMETKEEKTLEKLLCLILWENRECCP